MYNEYTLNYYVQLRMCMSEAKKKRLKSCGMVRVMYKGSMQKKLIKMFSTCRQYIVKWGQQLIFNSQSFTNP